MMPIHPRSLSTRLLHTTSLSRARLVNSTTSVSPDLGRAPAPQPPSPVWKPSSARAPHPPPAPTHKGPLRPDPQAQAILDKVGRRAPPPEAPHAARASLSPSPSPAAAPPDRQGELERAVALDLFLLRSLAQLTELEAASTAGPSASPPRSADLRTLLRQHREREGTVLDDTTLSYEPAPGPARRVRIDGGAEPAGAGAGLEGAAGESEQDGTVVVAHVLGGNETRVRICSGFAVGRPVGGGGGEEGQLVLSAAHTLESKHVELADPATPSATFILTSSGHAYPVTSLASSSSASDILLLRLSPTPLNNASPSSPVPALRPLPINPYPPPPESRIALHTYLNPLSRLSRKLARLPAREWARGRVAEYKDAAGRTAEVGTYDELAAMWVDCVPSEGSSGGPVVDCESGSVVGVTRGSTHAHGERQAYGFATPSERIFELFRLPGFKTTAEREADRLAARERAAVAEAEAEAAAGGPREGEVK
ncbi:hypothetical protein DMC30DRAFT_211996 [Rhodotorula diobovata]|uniref:Uncharacterized protein n=1 Tax=Rhodotorula diobovata TaxID=5288 RepID=A0A5C5FYB6_9BASI|nr:hypothetical protein DMC30DRAFT_211996 [Rhodotorula diobovata]